MGWVANTNPTGWYQNGWVWKFAVTVTVPMTHIGWGVSPPLSVVPAGMNGGIDFFRRNPGNVTANGFDGSSFGNDTGFFAFSTDSSWDVYGEARVGGGESFDLTPGTYYMVASLFHNDASPPTGVTPSWQPNTDWGTWVSRDGTMVNPPLIASAKPDGVGIYVVAVDGFVPEYTRLAYAYSATAGLYQQGILESAQNGLAPLRSNPSLIDEVAVGDLRGRTILPTPAYSFVASPEPAAVHILPSRNATATTIPTGFSPSLSQEPLRSVPTIPELIYALSPDRVRRGLADDRVTFVDEIVHSQSHDSLSAAINWSWVDKDNPARIYGVSSHGVWQVDLITFALTQLATFNADQLDFYNFDGDTAGAVIGQRLNGDIVTGSTSPWKNVAHSWGRDGSGVKTEAYLGVIETLWYPPIACAMLDDDTIFIQWPIYKTFWSTLGLGQDFPKDLTLKFYTQSLSPTYAPAFYEALPDNARLFTDGTTGWWTTMGRRGVEEDAPFRIDDTVPPHNGVGRTILSDIMSWNNNQYVINLDTFPVLPGDTFRFSLWLMPEDEGDGAVYGSSASLEVLVPTTRNPHASTFYFSIGDDGRDGTHTTLPAGVWTHLVVNGTVAGAWPLVATQDNGLRIQNLRCENIRGLRMWISDISLQISGHRDVSMKNIANLAWPEPDVSATQSRYYQFINGFPMVLEAQTLLTGAPARSGVNFN